MKKTSSGTFQRKLSRETTNAIADEKSRIRMIAGTATMIEFQK